MPLAGSRFRAGGDAIPPPISPLETIMDVQTRCAQNPQLMQKASSEATSAPGEVEQRCQAAEHTNMRIADLNVRLGTICQALTGEGQIPPTDVKPHEVKPSLLARMTDAQHAALHHIDRTESLVSRLEELV